MWKFEVLTGCWKHRNFLFGSFADLRRASEYKLLTPASAASVTLYLDSGFYIASHFCGRVSNDCRNVPRHLATYSQPQTQSCLQTTTQSFPPKLTFLLTTDSKLASTCSLQEEARARTVVLAAVDGQLAGVLAIADPLKTEAVLAVEGLRRMGIRSVMLTGDNWSTARAIAEEVGLGLDF